jgi:uncharacterized damage-inducible protein DinB
MEAGQAFIDLSRRYLKDEYLPKIRHAIRDLTEEDLWWRPNDASNSIGNLILHLAGNIRQWVLSGIAGAPDVRRRQEEFDQRGGMSVEELLAHLEGTVAEVDEALAQLPVEVLGEPRTIQGLEGTVMGALYHVVEHFSMHVGQIIYLSKARLGRDLGFYEIKDGKARPTW